MAYTNQMVLKAGTITLTGTANDSKYLMVVPAGFTFRLLKVIQRVTVAVVSDADQPQLTVMKKDGAADAVELKALTAHAIDAALATAVSDDIDEITNLTNYFKAGDTLDIQLKVAAAADPTPAGTVDVSLVIALDT